ncbi:DUF357 domain-containing protein [Candidatus Woesearchaeota archaeon]|nr:DUF357 domain-containing protein [Candidatus Woesearchaeota archaeon]
MDDKEIIKLIAKYRELSKKALELAKNAEKAFGMENWAEEVIEMAEAYINDSDYFEKKKDLLRALSSLAYAHGWLDAGARLGLYKVKNPRLFTVD